MRDPAPRPRLLRGRVLLGLVIVLPFVGLAGYLAWNRLEDRRRAQHAQELVSRLLQADIGQVPGILTSLDEYRTWTDPELARIADDPGRPPRQRLRASLALLPVDAERLPYLFERLLTVEPDELRVVRAQLQDRRDRLVEPLWQVLSDPEAPPGERLRAASALAFYDADNERWQQVADAVVRQLVKEHPLLWPQWVALLRPAGKHLLAPLGKLYRGRRPDDALERGIATRILADYAADEPACLFELIKDADPRQFAELIDKLDAYRAEVGLVMRDELQRSPPAGADDEGRERLARRQANAAVILYRMRHFNLVWPILRHPSDPRLRSLLIHALSAFRADPGPLIDRWYEEPDVAARRALLLSLGEYGKERFAPDLRERLTGEVLKAYRDDSDPGIHGAAAWLLRHWGCDARLTPIDEELKNQGVANGRSWYVNGQGQTLVLVDDRGGPAGASGPSFGIATKETSRAQFLRFRPESARGILVGEENGPVTGINWVDAAAYCRWLSEQEGISEGQMCYPPLSQIKSGMKLPADYLRRSGYRLPTEWEWEQTCRAGAATSRYYGESDELLGKYAWYQWNAGKRPQPGGLLKPNDLGLFDMLGNAMEWCHGLADDAVAGGRDAHDVEVVRGETLRAARGGGFRHLAEGVSSTQRDVLPASTRWSSVGFRVARTMPPRRGN